MKIRISEDQYVTASSQCQLVGKDILELKREHCNKSRNPYFFALALTENNTARLYDFTALKKWYDVHHTAGQQLRDPATFEPCQKICLLAMDRLDLRRMGTC